MREPITGMTRTNQCTRERSASMYSDSLTCIAPLMRYYGYGLVILKPYDSSYRLLKHLVPTPMQPVA